MIARPNLRSVGALAQPGYGDLVVDDPARREA